jgi:quercetin dioxygenase-like cupin family protein
MFGGRVLALSVGAIGLLMSAAPAQSGPEFAVRMVAQKKLSQLPAGPLFWRVENFATLAQAQTAEVPASFAAEVDGKAWLFTLGPKGGSTSGGTKIAEIGPVPKVPASQYLLRINEAGGPPGAMTPVHMHPGSESFYVLRGELAQKTPQGTLHVDAGQSMTGRTTGIAMEVSSSGTTALEALVMFLVDATKPFSSPAKFE